jgi:hypothetical protein
MKFSSFLSYPFTNHFSVSVTITTGLWYGDDNDDDGNYGDDKKQSSSGPYPSSYSMGTGVLSRG